MKIPQPFTIYDLRFTICKKSAVARLGADVSLGSANRKSPIVNRQSGLALVITLILLSVTLVMAIAFLAVSRRERVSVTTSTEITTARLAADTALAAAQAQILANIFAGNAALHNYRLLVSTNYVNGFGYTRGAANPTNVNYDVLNFLDPGTTAPWQPSDFVQNCAT